MYGTQVSASGGYLCAGDGGGSGDLVREETEREGWGEERDTVVVWVLG